MDDDLNPVVKGQEGHLHISGVQLARGYVNNPSLTAEKFIANPFLNGERMYDTGDIARELSDGSLAYLGRSDFQMKINGYRIEPSEIESKLLEIDMLSDVFITCDKDPLGNDFLLAYYTLNSNVEYSFKTKWKTIYENLYVDEFSANINNIGWKNSYDGALFSLGELAEWKNDVVNKMLSSKHCNAFEIGCGTGMIATSLQKSCTTYVGIDLSENVIKNLNKFCRQHNLKNMKLYTSDAINSVDLLENYNPDLIILNSVVQYFPNVVYLEKLLEKIFKKTTKETSIFIGDIRDFRLANAFYESIERFCNRSIDKSLIDGQIIFRSQSERELLISPEFFENLSEKQDCISYIEFLPKFGQHLNELNLFRYDAVLHLRDHVFEEDIPEYECIRDLSMFLNKTEHQNKFIVRNYNVEQWLYYIKSNEINSHKKKLTYLEDIKAIAKKKHGYNVYISLSLNSVCALDLLFCRQVISQNDIALLCGRRKFSIAEQMVSNAPDKNIPASYFKDFLKEKLPRYMVPDVFVRIDSIRLTSSGKLDKSVLFKISPIIKRQYYDKQKNEAEERLVEIWQNLLAVQNIGRKDDFWELGGNSLLAMQLVSELNYAFHIDCRLKDIFANAVLKDLASFVSKQTVCGDKRLIKHVGTETQLYELSDAQKSLWFIQETSELKNVYHAYFSTYIYGKFDIGIFKQCLLEIITHHVQLRVSVFDVEGKPWQKIEEPCLNYSEEKVCKEEISLKVNDEIAHPFNLRDGNLFRTKRLKVSEEESVIVFSFHHIISDRWSIGILINELNELYNSKSLGVMFSLKDSKYSYFDYINWQHEFQLTGEFNSKLNYWRQRLSEIPCTPLNISLKPRPPLVNYQEAVYSTRLTKDVYDKLKNFAKAKGVSIFMALLPVFQLVLSKLTGAKDITIGVPVANRELKDFESIIGLFVNTLPIRIVFDKNQTFSDFISSSAKQFVSDYENQSVPFDKIVNAVGGDKSLAYNPIFQIMFVFQNTREADLKFLGTSSKRLHLSSNTAKCDIVLTATEEDEGLMLDYEYARALFDLERIIHINRTFQETLNYLINNPKGKIFDDFVTSQKIVDIRHTQTKDVRDLIFDVKDQDDRIVVIHGDKHFSYGFINLEAERTKCYLLENSVEVGDVVAISLPDPIEFIIAICGILKAGGAYLPIDISIPQKRKDWMLKNSQAKLILDNLNFLKQQKLIKIKRKIGRRCYAYVIYTSGSTGQPKGVMITHENLLTTLQYLKNEYSISSNDTVLGVSNFSFDLSVFDVFGTFLSRACLVIPKDKKDPIEWAKLLKRFRVSIWNSVPTLMELLLDLKREVSDSLRLIILSDDKVSPNINESLRRLSKNPKLRIISAGGATECSIWSISYDMSRLKKSMNHVPYGRALGNQSVYVLNDFLKLTSENVPGEIFIGGNGVGVGYINQPELTAERFIANPFGNGDRLYKTGDLGVFFDGDIHILGRLDEQVKFHGHRIELKEIEKCIKFGAN